ncbi:MAG: cereblon family protein [Myxococcota bacterium]
MQSWPRAQRSPFPAPDVGALLLDTARTPGAGVLPEKEPVDTAKGPRHPVLCRRCAHVVTDAALRTTVDGQATHARLNPAGVLFVFDCFTDAPGCTVDGSPTTEATWFAGCAWQYAHCGRCGTHLGWRFTGALSFFGLVSERVVEE